MEFLYTWVNSLWGWWRDRTATVVFLGLDNTGKTTLMHMLRDNKLAQHMPTQKATMEVFTLGNITLRAHDLGGHKIARNIWTEYASTCDGIVFLVDASDQARIQEAGKELSNILAIEEIVHVPVLVLGNKIDQPGAMTKYNLQHMLGLAIASDRSLEVFMCSIIKRQGYKEGFDWLSRQLS